MTLNLIKEKIYSVNNIVIIGHIAPDADALGSTCGLAEGLINIGKKVYVVFEDKVPDNLEFILRGIRKKGIDVINYFPKDKNIELIIYCDLSSKSRIGNNLLNDINEDIFSICIDHHESNEQFSNLNYVIKNAMATCEIMYEVFNALNLKITPSIADSLFAGLSADSGSFRYSQTSPNTFFVAMKLSECGARTYDISTNLWSMKSRKKIELLKIILDRMEFSFNDKFVVSYVTLDDFKNLDSTKEHLEGLVSELRDIQGVILAVLVYEQEDYFKFSVRGKDENISTLPISTSFGGGGHILASAARINKDSTDFKEPTIEKIIGRIKDIVAKIM